MLTHLLCAFFVTQNLVTKNDLRRGAVSFLGRAFILIVWSLDQWILQLLAQFRGQRKSVVGINLLRSLLWRCWSLFLLLMPLVGVHGAGLLAFFLSLRHLHFLLYLLRRETAHMGCFAFARWSGCTLLQISLFWKYTQLCSGSFEVAGKFRFEFLRWTWARRCALKSDVSQHGFPGLYVLHWSELARLFNSLLVVRAAARTNDFL